MSRLVAKVALPSIIISMIKVVQVCVCSEFPQNFLHLQRHLGCNSVDGEKKKKKKKRGLFIGLRCQHTAWAKILESWKQISTTLVPFSSHISSFLISGHRLPFFQLSWSNSQLRGVRIYQPKPIIHFSNIYSIHLLFHIGIKFLKQMKYVGSKFWLATNERKIVALCRYCLLNIWVFQLVSTGDFLLL